MKPCRKLHNHPHRQMAAGQAAANRPAEMPVHRYTHPIRTVRPYQRATTEELLSSLLDALSRQSEQIGELLRRMDRDNLDTK